MYVCVYENTVLRNLGTVFERAPEKRLAQKGSSKNRKEKVEKLERK